MGEWKGWVPDFRFWPNLNQPAGRILSPPKHNGIMLGRACQSEHEDFRCQPRLGKRVSPDSASESAQTRKASPISPDSEGESAQTRKASQPRLGKRVSPDSEGDSDQPRLGRRVRQDSESESAFIPDSESESAQIRKVWARLAPSAGRLHRTRAAGAERGALAPDAGRWRRAGRLLRTRGSELVITLTVNRRSPPSRLGEIDLTRRSLAGSVRTHHNALGCRF